MQKTPPRYVPTLTQVIPAKALPDAAATPMIAKPSISQANLALNAEQISQQLRQQMLVRTRQYIDVELQRRIREAVSELALAHTHKMLEEMQPQLEATITQVVDEALQQAVAHAAAHRP